MIKNAIYILSFYLLLRLFKKGYDMIENQQLYLAKTLWGEARGEGKKGMQAVANVVMNRVQKGGWYGASIKDVVLKPYQFSCCNSNDINRAQLDNLTVDDLIKSGAWDISEKAINNELQDMTGGAINYHAKSVNPSWAKSMTKTVQIGNHIFYK